MKKRCFKGISLFLSMILLLLNVPFSAVATEIGDAQIGSDQTLLNEPMIADTVIIDPIRSAEQPEMVTIDQLQALGAGEKTLAELREMQVNLSSLPEVINTTVALEKGHVNRLTAQEPNLQTIVYQNTDGTTSTYLFNRPVKYVDTDGTVRDKSSQISSVMDTIYAYAMTDNNVKVYFPRTVTGGVFLQYEEYWIETSPITDNSSAPVYNSDEGVLYPNVFGTNTALRYRTELNGVKEDIVLIKNTGLNEFEFEMTAGGLTPVFTNGVWYLQNADGEAVASLGKILIEDSGGNSAEGTMNIVASEQGGYVITVTAPEAFLNAETTVYPVYVDPSTVIVEVGSYRYEDEYEDVFFEEYQSIIDTGVYSTLESANYAAWDDDYHLVGTDSRGSGKAIYKLYDFYGEHGQMKDLNQYQIGSATLYIDVAEGSSATFTVKPMTATWSSTLGTNPRTLYDATLFNSYSDAYSSSASVGTADIYELPIDITEIVRGWARYNSGESFNAYENPENGFVLSSNSYRMVLTAESDELLDDLYVIVDTSFRGGRYYINHKSSARYLKHSGTTVSTSTTMNTLTTGWLIDYIGGNKYYIRDMSNPSYALWADGGTVYTAPLVDPDTTFEWEISVVTNGIHIENVDSSYVLHYDGSNVFATIPSSYGEDDYDQSLWYIGAIADFVQLQSFTVTNDDWMAVGSARYSSITPTPADATFKVASCFTWESSNTSVAIVDEEGLVEGIGEGYVNIIVTHITTQKKYVFPIVVGRMLSSGIYQIGNLQSRKYLDIEGPSTAEGAYIQQWDRHTGTQAYWSVNYYGNGYYYLQSIYSGKYLGVLSASNTPGASIVQSETVSDGLFWKITKTIAGNYKFSPKCSESNSLVLAVPNSTSNGVNLQQLMYSSDSNYYDEWFVYYDATLLARIDEDNAVRNGYFAGMTLNLDYTAACNKTYLTCYSSEFTVNEMKTLLSFSKMFVIHTHGNKGIIKIGNNTLFDISDIMSTDMSQVRLAIFLTCLGGVGGYNLSNVANGIPQNIVEACVYSGATTVVAFSDFTYVDACNVWANDLIRVMDEEDKTLQEAITYLNDPEVTFGSSTYDKRYEMSEVAVVGGDNAITISEIFS